VCTIPEDTRTLEVLDWFRTNYPQLDMDTILLDRPGITRRCYGRDRAAVASKEDLIWYTDVDHYFGPNCLDTLSSEWETRGYREAAAREDWKTCPMMVYPKRICIQKDHASGDALCLWAQQHPQQLLSINFSEYNRMRYFRPIGGVQIVPGVIARRWGYLSTHRGFQEPLSRPFENFRDDVGYRMFLEQRGFWCSINVTTCYRLRHSATTYKWGWNRESLHP